MALLDGKVALISGVAGGQGGAHAVQLAHEGAILRLVSDQARYPSGADLPVDLGISNKAI